MLVTGGAVSCDANEKDNEMKIASRFYLLIITCLPDSLHLLFNLYYSPQT